MIFLFSSQAGPESSKISNDLIIRKLGHFSEYMALGFFSFCYSTNIFMILSFLFSVLYASSDEFHQTFVAGRDGNIVDVVIDSSGALVGILLSSIVYFLIIKK